MVGEADAVDEARGHPVVAVQQVPPHVDGESGEDGPLEHVHPTERVAAERAQELDDEGTDAQGQTTGQGEVEAEGVGPSQSGRRYGGTEFPFGWGHRVNFSERKVAREACRGGGSYELPNEP